MKHSMKTKIASIAMAAAMAVSMAVPTFAATTSYSVDDIVNSLGTGTKIGLLVDGYTDKAKGFANDVKDFGNSLKSGDTQSIYQSTMNGIANSANRVFRAPIEKVGSNNDGIYEYFTIGNANR